MQATAIMQALLIHKQGLGLVSPYITTNFTEHLSI